MIFRCIFQFINAYFWDHQKVHRSLWWNIVECQTFGILVNDVSGNFSGDDFVENCGFISEWFTGRCLRFAHFIRIISCIHIIGRFNIASTNRKIQEELFEHRSDDHFWISLFFSRFWLVPIDLYSSIDVINISKFMSKKVARITLESVEFSIAGEIYTFKVGEILFIHLFVFHQIDVMLWKEV